MGTTLTTRGNPSRFLAGLLWISVFISACAYKSGFNGEHMLEGGGGKSVYCGPSGSAPRLAGPIVLFRANIETGEVFAHPSALVDSIQAIGRATGKCTILESDRNVELLPGTSYLRVTRYRIEAHQPFGNPVRVNGKPFVTDTTVCLRLQASLRVDRDDGWDSVRVVFNSREPYFDSEVLAFFKGLCRAD